MSQSFKVRMTHLTVDFEYAATLDLNDTAIL